MRVTSLRWLAVIATTPLALLGVGPSQADIIHESATLGRTGQQGGTTLGEQFLGSRFTITQTVNVTLIGGHMEATGTLFGAIVALSGPSALPSGSPVDDNWLASTVFSPGTPSTDARTPLAVTLPPGDYALIFGSQQFGATGEGAMPGNDTDIPGQASYFFWNGSNWQDGEPSNTRFVVEDTILVPVLPAWAWLALALLLAGGATLALRRRTL